MTRKILLAAATMWLTYGCTDDSAPQEPVAATDEAKPPVPDQPGGNSGETKDKPAGEGAAGQAAAPAAPAPAPEKSVPPPAPAVAAGSTMMVNIAFLNVRKGPSMKDEKLRIVKQGDKLQVQGCKLGWCQIGAAEYVGQKFLQDVVK